ncbi:hypothetical protein PSHT_06088 [Puccinia striiformis]|uniref:Uncharacterized protein n=1 Tax=Puccinia striiformis TaxID=27350 RepID=A0A2S4W8X5_9BASI|nr:hypothetical protein PSHT_06088 [Puccinia striiformis]
MASNGSNPRYAEKSPNLGDSYCIYPSMRST